MLAGNASGSFSQVLSIAVTSMIIGHEMLRERLRRSVVAGRVSHAYLFSGPESVGKFPVAQELSSILFDAKNQTDITVIRPDRVEEKGKVREEPIGVDRVREAIRNGALSSRSAGRVLIVDDADRLSEAAQNAFLKTLEEPFPRTAMILVTHNEGALLETVRSRCERVVFSLVHESAMKEAFPGISETILRMGRPGIARRSIEEPDALSEDIGFLEILLSFDACSFEERARVLEAFSADVPRAERVLSWWAGALSRSVYRHLSLSDRVATLRLLESVASTTRSMRRFPGSIRLTLETLLFFGKSVSPLLAPGKR